MLSHEDQIRLKEARINLEKLEQQRIEIKQRIDFWIKVIKDIESTSKELITNDR